MLCKVMEKIVILSIVLLLVLEGSILLTKNPEPWARRFLIGRHDWSKFNPKKFKQIHASMAFVMALLLVLMPFVPTDGLPWVLGTMFLVLLLTAFLLRRHAFDKSID